MTREIIVMCRHIISVPLQLTSYGSGELNANLRSQSLAQATLESRPCPLFYSDEKIKHRRVEQLGFLKIEEVSTVREETQPRIGYCALHEQSGFNAGFVFVAHHYECGSLDLA